MNLDSGNREISMQNSSHLVLVQNHGSKGGKQKRWAE